MNLISWWSPGDNDEKTRSDEDEGNKSGGSGQEANEKTSGHVRKGRSASSDDVESFISNHEWARGRQNVRAGTGTGSDESWLRQGRPSGGVRDFGSSGDITPATMNVARRLSSVSRSRPLGSVGEGVEVESVHSPV